MYFIAQDIETHRYYVLNAEEGTIEGIADTEERCHQHIKYMTFHDFYYSVRDRQGRSQVPSVTMDYLAVFRAEHHQTEHDAPASGWWSYTHPVGRKFSIPCTPVLTINYWDVFTSIKDTHIANYFFQPDMSRASGWTYQLT